jgi:hypothetical protein
MTTGLLSDAEKNTLYPTVLAVSPSFANDQTIYFGTRRNGLLCSKKGGYSIKIIENNFGLVNSLVLSPNFKLDKTLFVSARGKGIFRSTNAGKTWNSINNGLNFVDEWERDADGGMMNSTTINRSPYYDIKLTVSPAFTEDRTLFSACGEGLFKSVDAGENWRRMLISPQNKTVYVLTMAVSKDFMEDQTVLVSVKGAGLYKSVNGGDQFSRIGQDLLKANYSIFHIEFSPNYSSDNTIYAASEEELFRSFNGGEKWQIIKRPLRYENNRDVVVYSGKWEIIRDPKYSAGSASYGHAENNRASFNFVGTGIRLLGEKSNRLSGCKIYLNGELIGYLDQYDASDSGTSFSYAIENLIYGPHHIILEVQKGERKESKSHGIIIDAFDVIGRHGRF